MDAQRQKHRMTRWLGKLFFVVLSLMTSCGVRAAPVCTGWASNINWVIYPTPREACQAIMDYYNSADPWASPFVLTSDNGQIQIPGYGTIRLCIYNYKNVVGASFSIVCQKYGIPNTVSIEPAATYQPINGTYTIMPSTALPLYAVVKDQNGVVQAGKQVTITAGVQAGTGGHLHFDNRPKGQFACSSVIGAGSASATCTLTTDNNGQAPFIFIPTAVSGAHTITATCSDCSNTATTPVNVMVDHLIPIPGSSRYALSDSKGVIGAIPGKHTDNHYLTSTAITKLKGLADIYTTVNPGAKLYLNDASLVWGGLFDVDVDTTPWVSPHSLHDTGVSLDIRAANSGPNNEGAVPATLFQRFIKDAKKKGFKIGLHCKNSTDANYCLGQPNNRHFHVDF